MAEYLIFKAYGTFTIDYMGGHKICINTFQILKSFRMF